MLSCRGVGPSTARLLIESSRTLEELSILDKSTIHIPKLVMENWPSKTEWINFASKSRKIIENSINSGIRSISLWHSEYPKLLRLIPDPPLNIYIKGKLFNSDKIVACVGTRQPTKFGEVTAEKITSFLSMEGWSITSGLAFGIDTISHQTALRSSGHTTAVLAGPLDSIYPKKNKFLAETILESGGALVSEQPLGSPVGKANFIKRDRIQSGLSIATIIYQTGIKGGAMHTAKFSLMQNRLLVVPIPSGLHRLEEKSQGIIALASLTGTPLANFFNADKDLLNIIQSKFMETPPALGINNNLEYINLIRELEIKLNSINIDRRIIQPSLFD